MKQCCEYVRGLRYKLRMMGIPCQGPAYIQGDNQSVLAITSNPDSTLKKKSQNEADLLTKLLPSGDKRKRFVESLLLNL